MVTNNEGVFIRPGVKEWFWNILGWILAITTAFLVIAGIAFFGLLDTLIGVLATMNVIPGTLDVKLFSVALWKFSFSIRATPVLVGWVVELPTTAALIVGWHAVKTMSGRNTSFTKANWKFWGAISLLVLIALMDTIKDVSGVMVLLGLGTPLDFPPEQATLIHIIYFALLGLLCLFGEIIILSLMEILAPDRQTPAKDEEDDGELEPPETTTVRLART